MKGLLRQRLIRMFRNFVDFFAFGGEINAIVTASKVL